MLSTWVTKPVQRSGNTNSGSFFAIVVLSMIQSPYIVYQCALVLNFPQGFVRCSCFFEIEVVYKNPKIINLMEKEVLKLMLHVCCCRKCVAGVGRKTCPKVQSGNTNDGRFFMGLSQVGSAPLFPAFFPLITKIWQKALFPRLFSLILALIFWAPRALPPPLAYHPTVFNGIIFLFLFQINKPV